MKGRQGENPGEVGLTAKKKVYFFFLGSAFFSGFFAMVKTPPLPKRAGVFYSIEVYKYFLSPRHQLSRFIY
jgi:hypothetical protein